MDAVVQMEAFACESLKSAAGAIVPAFDVLHYDAAGCMTGIVRHDGCSAVWNR